MLHSRFLFNINLCDSLSPEAAMLAGARNGNGGVVGLDEPTDEIAAVGVVRTGPAPSGNC